MTSKLRAGDTISFITTVASVYDNGDIEITVKHYGDEITHIEPRPLAVGDFVKASNSDSEMRVIAIDDDEAFIRSKTSGRSYIEKLDTLTRCP